MKKIIIAFVMGFMFIAPPLTQPAHATLSNNDTFRQLDLLIEIFERVRSQYVEEVDDKELLEAAIRGMLNELDPHSSYMGPESFRESQQQQRGEYGGIGIEILPEHGMLKVISPFDDTPASRAGIMPGDFITHVDDVALTSLTSNEAVEKLRGPAGASVDIIIYREGAEAPLEITLVREVITVSAVRHTIERDNIGYIRLTTFNNENLSDDLLDVIKEIQNELGDDLKGYVLDLRNNPGGLLTQAVEVSDVFLPRGGEITSMRGRNRADSMRWSAKTNDQTQGLPIVVLVNAGSASASEIVTGALQDHRRATIIGERTFGKGVVQTVIPLGGERALRLTTARYYTPAGTSIQATGIEPDIIVEQPRRGQPRREVDLAGHIENENGEDEAVLTDEAADEVADEVVEADVDGDENTEATEEEVDASVDYQLRYALDLLEGVIHVSDSQDTVE
ncbi:MAG: S41 family peptidase [Sphingomonadales bacterium]|nr:S41 family peptidase [Sphingomonadales bacterium]